MSTLIKKSKTYVDSISEAYNMLVTFRKLVEERPNITAYTPEQIERVYQNMWCDGLPNHDAPWK